jgi:hypothetical protein
MGPFSANIVVVSIFVNMEVCKLTIKYVDRVSCPTECVSDLVVDKYIACRKSDAVRELVEKAGTENFIDFTKADDQALLSVDDNVMFVLGYDEGDQADEMDDIMYIDFGKFVERASALRPTKYFWKSLDEKFTYHGMFTLLLDDYTVQCTPKYSGSWHTEECGEVVRTGAKPSDVAVIMQDAAKFYVEHADTMAKFGLTHMEDLFRSLFAKNTSSDKGRYFSRNADIKAMVEEEFVHDDRVSRTSNNKKRRRCNEGRASIVFSHLCGFGFFLFGKSP